MKPIPAALRSGSGTILAVILCLMIPVSRSQAQTGFREGFVVRTNGDTLTGWVYYSLDNSFRTRCRFKRFEIAPVVYYRPGEITGFGFRNGRYFESLSREGHTRFYECLSKGIENRYLLPGKSGRQAFLVADTPDTGLVRAYNRTAAAGIWDDCSITRTSPLWRVGVTAGYQLIRIRIPPSEQTRYFGEARYDRSYNPVAGIVVSRSISRKKSTAFIDLAFLYVNAHYYGYAAYQTQADCRDEIFIRFSGLQVPLAFRYSLGGRNVKPFFKFGLYGTFMFDTDYYRFSERQFGQQIFTDRHHDFALRNEFGYLGGIGAEFHAGQIRRITCEISFLNGSKNLITRQNMYSVPLNTHLRTAGAAIMFTVNL
jgi:hypothetical protein